MTSTQIDGIFATMDGDQSGDVSDAEWESFFTEFIAPFIACDADKDNLMIVAELTTCLASADSKIGILKNSFTGNEAKVLEFMDI